ncbi:Uncharacterized protein FKW44_011893 [Caligus rogercresseyi]|uniref:Uncharacterized protein n=1 Tax=Caligus rogercresseyi TaxID=217165 RepID=A0A7T8K959_CALRO|nr:Uncharacterized protein FKW44_011893 [Caligus rogercresseyi]
MEKALKRITKPLAETAAAVKTFPEDCSSLMGKKCCVPGCRSGYAGEPKGAYKSAQSLGPSDPRVNEGKLGENSAVCSKHFKAIKFTMKFFVCSSYIKPKSNLMLVQFSDSDYQEASQDMWRHRTEPLKLRILKKEAVPFRSDNLPSYFSTSLPEPKSPTATSLSRHERAEQRVEDASEAFLRKDRISSLKDLQKKLDRTCMPRGIVEVEQDGELLFISIDKDKDVPMISFSMAVNESLEVRLCAHGLKVPMEKVSHLTGLESKVELCSQSRMPSNNVLKPCIDLLDGVLQDVEDGLQQKLLFIKDQLNLASKSPFQRRYSTLLLATAVMWHNISPALYRQIQSEGLITLPHDKYLQRISGGLSMQTGLPSATESYLRTRIEKLSTEERQFFEAERKIRFKSLVKVNKLTMTEVTDIFREPEEHKAKINEEGDKLLACLSSDNLCSESVVQLSGEEGVVYYIGGHIAKSLLKRTKCKSCSTLLAKSHSPPNLELLEDDEEGNSKKEEFLQLLNRGDLVTPSDLVYLTCMHALQLKAELFDDDYIQELFLASSYPQAVFVNILTKKISNTSASDSIFGQVCDSSHSFQAFVPFIAAKFFNCMSKNFVQSINDKIHAGRKRGNVKESSSVRKIAKLQS